MSDFFPENNEMNNNEGFTENITEKADQLAESASEAVKDGVTDAAAEAEKVKATFANGINDAANQAQNASLNPGGFTQIPTQAVNASYNAQPAANPASAPNYQPRNAYVQNPQQAQPGYYSYNPNGAGAQYYAQGQQRAAYGNNGQQGAPYGYAPPRYSQEYAPGNAQKEGFKAQESAPAKKETPKKSSGNAARIVLAVILAITLIAAAAGAGYVGTYLYHKQHPGEGGTAVMYRSVDSSDSSSSKSDEEGASSANSIDVVKVSDMVSDSVVEITTEFVTKGYFGYGQYVTKGAGSGVIVSDEGYVVTNNHVIADTDNGNTLADTIMVRLRNGEEYKAEVIGRDADEDIAVIKIDADDLTAAVWGDSDSLKVGEQIVVVGNPLGELGGTVTTGIVSASDREIKVDDIKMSLIQTDAAVNPGNSGGGMFNSKGELVGIVNAKSSGTGIEGLGFAIPSSEAMSIVEQLLEYGYVKGKTYIGISFYEASTGGFFSTDNSSVLYVYYAEEGYNDDVLKKGDQVVSVDGTSVSSRADVKAILAEHEVGDKLTFSIIRDGKSMDVEVTCYEYVPSENDR